MHGTVRTGSLTWIATAIVLSVMATLLVTQAWRVEAAPGAEESSFVPVTPCRLFDFRAGADNVGPRSTPLGPGESNVYTQPVRGANGNCVIPPDATAISMNVTIANPTSQSNLRVFPADVGTPTASNLNWLAGQSPTPNKVDVKLSSDGTIKLYNHTGSVDVLADVVGYYTNSTLQDLASSVAGLESSLEVANAKIEEAEAKTMANELLIEQSLARVEVLEDAQPFTLDSTRLNTVDLSSDMSDPTQILSRSVAAPVAGTVSVHVSAFAQGGTKDEDRAICAITTGTSVANSDILILASPIPSDGFPGLAGVRSFSVAADTTTEFKLLCYELNGSISIGGASMAAIFTPAP